MSELAAIVQRVTRKLRLLAHIHPDSLVAIEYILDDTIQYQARRRDGDLLLRIRVVREAREQRH